MLTSALFASSVEGDLGGGVVGEGIIYRLFAVRMSSLCLEQSASHHIERPRQRWEFTRCVNIYVLVSCTHREDSKPTQYKSPCTRTVANVLPDGHRQHRPTSRAHCPHIQIHTNYSHTHPNRCRSFALRIKIDMVGGGLSDALALALWRKVLFA